MLFNLALIWILSILDPYNKDYSFTVCQLEASDGDLSHTVTIVNQWIFDSNFRQALSLTKQNLDKCCSLGNNQTKKLSMCKSIPIHISIQGKNLEVLSEHKEIKTL